MDRGRLANALFTIVDDTPDLAALPQRLCAACLTAVPETAGAIRRLYPARPYPGRKIAEVHDYHETLDRDAGLVADQTRLRLSQPRLLDSAYYIDLTVLVRSMSTSCRISIETYRIGNVHAGDDGCSV